MCALRRGYFDGNTPLSIALQRVFDDIAQAGLDALSPFPDERPGDYALPRLYESAAALNRLRSLRIHQVGRDDLSP
jgi:hypothetical protein